MNLIKLNDEFTLVFEKDNHSISHTKCMTTNRQDGHITNVYKAGVSRWRNTCNRCQTRIIESVYEKAQFIVGDKALQRL